MKYFIFALLFMVLCFISAQPEKPNNDSIEKLIDTRIDSFTQAAIQLNQIKKYKEGYDVMKNLFTVLKKVNKFEAAIKRTEKVASTVPLTEREYYFKINIYLGLLYERTGNIFDAFKIFEAILKQLNNNPKEAEYYIKSYNYLGRFFTKTRSSNEAIAHYKKAMHLAIQIKDTSSYLKIIENLGIAYIWHNDQVVGRKYLAESLLKNPERTSEINIELARSFLFEKKHTEGIKYGLKALQESLRVKNEEAQFLANSILGELYNAQGKHTIANQYFQKAFQFKSVIQDKREWLKFQIAYANNGLKLKKADFVIALLHDSHKEFNYKEKSKIDITPAEMNLVDVYYTLGNAFMQKYESTKEIDYFDQSNFYFDRSIRLLEDMRKYHSSPFTIEDISYNNKHIYEHAIINAYRQFQLTKEEKYRDRALQIAQKFNSFNFRKSISERNALELSIQDENTRNRYLTAKIELQNQLFHIENETTDSTYSNYITSKNLFNFIKDSLVQHNRQFAKLIEEIRYVDKKDIQKNLGDSTTMLYYFMGEQVLFRFTIGKSSMDMAMIDNDSLLNTNAYQYIKNLSHVSNKNSGSQIQSAYYLYKKLIPAIPKQSNRLIIVPDGYLYRLPFEAFITTQDSTKGIVSEFLISKYNIHYLYYPAQILKSENEKVNKFFYAVGLEYDDYTLKSMEEFKKDTLPEWINDKFRSEAISHLYFADDEAQSLSKMYNGSADVNENALKKNIILKAPKTGIMHISAHSFIDFDNPRKSAIIMTKKANEENLITYDDIAVLQLSNQMVTLSSCNSSIGKISNTEGVSSLTKAFLESGSQAVVGSFWSVPDQYSKIFMELFYSKLKTGMKKDEALRATKLELMSKETKLINPSYKTPTFWAAWNIYGNMDPLQTEQNIPWLNILTIILLISIVYYFIKSKKVIA